MQLLYLGHNNDKANLVEGPERKATEWPPKGLKIAGAQAEINGLLNRYSMEHAKLKTCKHCGGPLEPRPMSEGKHCPTCDATNDPKNATSMEHKNKIAAFIHEELIVAGGGDITYAEMIQLSRRASRRLLIAAARAAVLTPILWTGFLLFRETALIGFWEAFTWREIVEIWEEPKWGRIVGLWAIVILIDLIPAHLLPEG